MLEFGTPDPCFVCVVSSAIQATLKNPTGSRPYGLFEPELSDTNTTDHNTHSYVPDRFMFSVRPP